MLEMIYSRIWKQAEKQGKDKILKRAIRINNRFKSIGIDMSRKLFSQIYKETGRQAPDDYHRCGSVLVSEYPQGL